MTIYAWPATRSFMPTTALWRVIDDLQRVSQSPLSGSTQTLSMPGARWGWSYDFGAHGLAERNQLEAYLLRLNGREHRVRLWDQKFSRPRGTCNLAGVTLASDVAQFAVSVVLTGCGVLRTLLAGDWIGLANGQLVRCVADAMSDTSGVMPVEVRHMMRSALPAGGVVTLDRPTALYIRADSNLAAPRQLGQSMPGFSIEFTEVFA
jgi:hypothetical protein